MTAFKISDATLLPEMPPRPPQTPQRTLLDVAHLTFDMENTVMTVPDLMIDNGRTLALHDPPLPHPHNCVSQTLGTKKLKMT